MRTSSAAVDTNVLVHLYDTFGSPERTIAENLLNQGVVISQQQDLRREQVEANFHPMFTQEKCIDYLLSTSRNYTCTYLAAHLPEQDLRSNPKR